MGPVAKAGKPCLSKHRKFATLPATFAKNGISMRFLKPYVAALILMSGPLSAQDIMGFDPASFGSVVLSQKQFGSDTQLELAVGDYNNEFISNYSSGSIFAQLGLSVGRLDILTDSRTFPCTAFLVDDDLLMTNHHCVPGILDNPDAQATAIVAVQFMTGYVQEGVAAGTERFNVNPVPVETNKELDYTLLRVVGKIPGKRHGKLALASVTPKDKDPYWIIGHPMGEAQRISREKCAAHAPALSQDRLLHTCDTLPGNSGSPVIDASTQTVIALHHAGSRQNSVNYAVPMALILANSAVLRSLMPGADPAPAPAPQPDPEDLALQALSAAMLLSPSEQIDALLALQRSFPDTKAATAAERLLALLVPPIVDPASVDPPVLTFEQRMAKNTDVQDCDRLAGHVEHPDKAAGLMSAKGTPMSDIRPAAAIPACRKAVAAFPDHPRLLMALGRALDADQQFESAASVYRDAANLGDPIAQFNLGSLSANGEGVRKSPTAAADWFRKSAEQGFVHAQTNLGFRYRDGDGVTKSDTTAVIWFRKAAEQGHASAQNALGFMYFQGRGVPKSNTIAIQWYRMAADQGLATAQNNLGNKYRDGDGVARSYETAINWYRKAAGQKLASAQNNLGSMYTNGRGVPKSYSTAVDWFRKAAEQGHAAAQSNLGVMYETGSGVPKSATQAASYFVLGLQGGNAFILNRAPSEWDTETAREMQRRLSALVFYDGAIDGKIGPQSIAAMRRLLP
jgi:TPR repeat protein/V8-like Glu-specific endopeptidase